MLTRWFRRGRAAVLTLLGFVLFAALAAANTPDPKSVTIAGSLDSQIGCSADWQPNCAAAHLTYSATNGMWTGTWTVPAGNWEYKAALNDSWDENYGLHAQSGGGNIPLSLATAKAVKFYYDHKTQCLIDHRDHPVTTGDHRRRARQ